MNIRAFTYEHFESFTDADFGESLHEMREAVATGKIIPPEMKPEIPPETQPEPSFTQQELEIAKSLAREEGIREGLEQAKKKYEEEKLANDNKTNEVLDKLNLLIASMIDSVEQRKQKTTEQIARISFAIAKSVCGRLPEDVVQAEIQSVIDESLKKFDRKEPIKIWLNPKNVADLNDKFTQAEVNGDEVLEPGDFRIEWNNGFAHRSLKKLWNEVEATISRHSTSPHESEEAEPAEGKTGDLTPAENTEQQITEEGKND